MSFVHLNCHSNYSFHDGVCSPTELVKNVVNSGQNAVGLTDICNFYGVTKFVKACAESKVRPIIGCEIWIDTQGLDNMQYARVSDRYKAVLLVKNKEGFYNLNTIVSHAINEGMYFRPYIDFDTLKEHSEGLIAILPNMNGPAFACVNEQKPKSIASRNIKKMLEVFEPPNIYLGLQRYGQAHEELINRLHREIGQSLSIPTVVLNDVKYGTRYQASTLDLLHSLARNEYFFDETRRHLPTDQQYCKSYEEIVSLFQGDEESIQNTVKISEMCNFHLEAITQPLKDGQRVADQYHFPILDMSNERNPVLDDFKKNFPIPSYFSTEECNEPINSVEEYFEWFCEAGLSSRFSEKEYSAEQEEAYKVRLKHEIQVIRDMGFSLYMLIVADSIHWAKSRGISVGPGRGSAVSSVVCWAMGITEIPPLKHDLLFERFLNIERVSMPDIDVDFCAQRREELFEYVKKKYGESVAKIATIGRFKARSSIQAIGNTLGINRFFLSDYTKLVDMEVKEHKKRDRDEERSEKSRGLADLLHIKGTKLDEWASISPKSGIILHLSKIIEKMPRQRGIHAAGAVIADKKLLHYSSLEASDDLPTLQLDMGGVEDMKLIKFDFLGLESLDKIDFVLNLIDKENRPDLQNLEITPEDAVWETLSSGNTQGIFQLESKGIQNLIRKVKPSNLEEIIAVIALYRPGPLRGGMDKRFVEYKHNPEQIPYDDDRLQPILESTYGCVIYQEQVMKIAEVLGNFSLNEADELRRVMAKKKTEKLEPLRKKFVEGCVRNDIQKKTADKIFSELKGFAEYGFNKSHSAAYGQISLWMAWLKTHFYLEYQTMLLNFASSADVRYEIIKSLQYPTGDLPRIKILPPCINSSLFDYSIEEGSIRCGLKMIKGVQEKNLKHFLSIRNNSKFSSLGDFIIRTDVRQNAVKSLIFAGAFDWTSDSRKSMTNAIDNVTWLYIKNERERIRSGQLRMNFNIPSLLNLKNVDEEWELSEYSANEEKSLDMYLSCHPVDEFREISSDKLSDSNRKWKDVIAIVRKVHFKDERMNQVIVEIEDDTGRREVRFNRGDMRRFGISKNMIGNIYKVSRVWKTLSEEKGSWQYTRFEPLQLLEGLKVERALIKINVDSRYQYKLDAVRQILKQYPGDIPVELMICEGDFSAILGINVSIRPVRILKRRLVELLEDDFGVRYLSL